MSAKSRANKLRKLGQVESVRPDVPTPTASGVEVNLKAKALPARAIKNSVAGEGASATFKGIGTMAEHGIPSGLRRNEFQDRVLALNEGKDYHMSDDELALVFDNEFPMGGVRITDRPELVQVIRKFYNNGTHGKQQGGVKPAIQSLQYEKPKVKAGATVPADSTPVAKSATA